ncbi:MAG: ammonia-forming cytochrome c nitrite reductase subunit c552 [Candidatus Aminicenantes bacterium]|nr:ammonia-forming cytochrome c nitrite reductase subunit c552 [Candidatus Aminicenantes bacterium]
MSLKHFLKTKGIFIIVFLAAATATAAVLLLLINIKQHKQEALQYPLQVVEISADEIDPRIWGKNFPFEFDSFMKTRTDYGETPYGGSTPYSKLERYPAMKRLWAGYSFGIDYDEERGHIYASLDQMTSKRVMVVSQPGACVNCHAAEAPGLIKKMGWENFNRTPYNQLKPNLKTGSSCADCHDPRTMDLRITRPAFIRAFAQNGRNLSRATRQEMRTYVCAQCHSEYYFKGKNKVLTFPWSMGRTIEAIEEHYDAYAFSDWNHQETGAPLIKVQHPDFELWETGIHARSGLACADCHMPYIREGGVKISDHWIRSPLVQLNSSCQTCHNWPEEELKERILNIQHKTAALLRKSEEALLSAVDAIKEAKAAGLSDEQLAKALKAQRKGQLRWDFIVSENSTGFHSPQEAARILAEAIDFARLAEIEALRALKTP